MQIKSFFPEEQENPPAPLWHARFDVICRATGTADLPSVTPGPQHCTEACSLECALLQADAVLSSSAVGQSDLFL